MLLIATDRKKEKQTNKRYRNITSFAKEAITALTFSVSCNKGSVKFNTMHHQKANQPTHVLPFEI